MVSPQRQPTRMALGEVDPVQPIDPTSSLAEGLEGLWLPLPHLVGGSRLYDLSGHGRNAVINQGSHAWGSQAEFLMPSLTFDGNQSDYLDVTPVDPTIGLTISVYVDVPSTVSITTARYDQIFRFSDTDILLTTYSNYLSASGQTQGKIYDGSSEHEVVGTDISGGGPVLLTLTWGQNGMRLYEDDNLVGSNSFTGSVAGASANPEDKDRLIIGWADDGYDNFEGELAGVYLSTEVALSHSKVASLSDQARRGFPDLLRRRDQSALYVSGTSAVTLATNELQHGHTLEPSTVTTVVTLGTNDLTQSHTLGQTAVGVTFPLSTDEIQHVHSLEQSSVGVNFSLTTNELQQPHSLSQPSFSVGYSLTTDELGQGHTLESPSLAIAGLLTPEDVQHGHTLADTLVGVQYALSTDELQQSHTVEQSGVQVAYALTTDGLRHLHNLDATTLGAALGLTPDDLSHAHTVESPSGSGLVILSVDGMRHPHTLEDVVLGTVGFATQIDIAASPLYQTESSAGSLYQITLDAQPILD